MKKLVLALLAFLAIAALALSFAWSLWLTEDFAKNRAEEAFLASWAETTDGCGFNCQGCGAREAHRSRFGFLVTIVYACGLIPADLPEYHQVATGFVSPIGTVHGFPSP